MFQNMNSYNPIKRSIVPSLPRLNVTAPHMIRRQQLNKAAAKFLAILQDMIFLFLKILIAAVFTNSRPDLKSLTAAMIGQSRNVTVIEAFNYRIFLRQFLMPGQHELLSG